jgi:hypothetical protein
MYYQTIWASQILLVELMKAKMNPQYCLKSETYQAANH